MKITQKVLIVVMIVMGASFNYNLNAQEQAQDTELKPLAEFNTTSFDFGKIKQKVPAKAVFKVTNSSMVPLLITNVKPTCGCTVANYPKEPIKPGETAEIIATYNANSVGKFTKSVYVYTNSTQDKITLTMKGEVLTAQAYAEMEEK